MCIAGAGRDGVKVAGATETKAAARKAAAAMTAKSAVLMSLWTLMVLILDSVFLVGDAAHGRPLQRSLI
jgi:hypothetical protein